MKSTTQDKWDKFKGGLSTILAELQDDGMVSSSKLRSTAGLGINITEIYTDYRPYLKSMFLTLESWRDGRDAEGWKLSVLADRAAYMESQDLGEVDPEGEAPPEVKATPGLVRDAKALLQFFAPEAPLLLPVRPRSKDMVAYVGGDASGNGFGAGTQIGGDRVYVQHGQWKEEDSKRGSNWREGANLANRLLRDIAAGRLDEREVWVVTDNRTWASVCNKGTSTSQQLYDLMIELRIAVRDHGIFLHVLHVSGRRMIKMGFDGLSRGDFETGVMTGKDVRDFLPLDEGAFEMAGKPLTSWVQSWMGDDWSPPLSPEGWFTTGHQPGTHVWAPPPAAALDALEQLSMARLKRPFEGTHVVLIPRLLYEEEWRRRFEKEVDVWFHMSTGEAWPNFCCEPLVVGISFPMRREEPWLLRRSPPVVELGRAMQEVSKTSNLELGGVLREFWSNPWGLS